MNSFFSLNPREINRSMASLTLSKSKKDRCFTHPSKLSLTVNLLYICCDTYQDEYRRSISQLYIYNQLAFLSLLSSARKCEEHHQVMNFYFLVSLRSNLLLRIFLIIYYMIAQFTYNLYNKQQQKLR